MAHIEIRIAAHVGKRCVLGTEINRVRPSIGGERGQPMAEPPLELHLQSIVVRGQCITEENYIALEIWINGMDEGGPLLQQSSPVCTHIRDSKRLRLAQSLLDAHIPLKRIGQLQMSWKRPRCREWRDRWIHARGGHPPSPGWGSHTQHNRKYTKTKDPRIPISLPPR